MKEILIDILVPLSGKGGVESVINATAKYLNRHGFHVRVVQMVFDGPFWLDEGIDFYPLLIKKKVHTISDMIPLYSEFLKRNGVPDIVLACPWPFLTLTARRVLAAFDKPCKVVSWMHGPIEKYEQYGVGGLECLRYADAHMVINERTANTILLDKEDSRVYRVYNPVDFSACVYREHFEPEAKTLLFVGRLSEEKNVELLVRAAAMTRSGWKLRIIGEGPDREKLQRLCGELGMVDRVEFLGWQQEPWKHSEHVTALALASEYEGFPLSAVEALASGLPVISTPVDGITELVRPGVNGYLYPKDSPKELAELLDMVSDGKLPAILPEKCRESAACYERTAALEDFRGKLLEVLDKISVIVPCYNVEKLIRRCLDSILSQTLTKARLEIICVDDCSTDGTLGILQEYEKKYPEQFILIPLEQNGRQGRARNIALQYAGGDYIAYVDSDDVIAPEMLEKLYEKAALTGCDIVECNYKDVPSGEDFSVEVRDQIQYYDMTSVEQRKKYILKRGWKTAPWGRLYRREFLIAHDIRFAEDIYMEDILFSERCMQHLKSYILLPETLYFYCYNENGTMLGSGIRHYYMDTARVQNMAADTILNENGMEGCLEEFEYLHFTKAFEEPVRRMWENTEFFSYEKLQWLKRELLRRFPDILQNGYVLGRKDTFALLCRKLLERDFTKEQLKINEDIILPMESI